MKTSGIKVLKVNAARYKYARLSMKLFPLFIWYIREFNVNKYFFILDEKFGYAWAERCLETMKPNKVFMSLFEASSKHLQFLYCFNICVKMLLLVRKTHHYNFKEKSTSIVKGQFEKIHVYLRGLEGLHLRADVKISRKHK